MGDWPKPKQVDRRQRVQHEPQPAWALLPVVASRAIPATLSPSDLGGPKILGGEADGRPEAEALRHGSHLHLLLEHLPNLPRDDWRAAAEALLAGQSDPATKAETEAAVAEAAAVLTEPGLAAMFSARALCEVELTAALPELGGRRIHGAIDRLIIGPDEVLAIDYKSNAVVPASSTEVPEGLLRQMGAYASALTQIYPGRRIRTAILWTTARSLMPLDTDIVRQALSRSTIP